MARGPRSRNGSRPPRIGRWLIARLVGPARAGEVQADLAEVYRLQARRRGLAAARARYLREVAGLALWRVRSSRPRRRSGLDGLFHDLRHGARALRRRPAFTTMAILSLGLGIGLSTAMFTILEAVVLRPLALPRANDVVFLSSVRPGGEEASVSGPDFLVMRQRLTRWAGAGTDAPFEDLAGFQFWLPTVVTDQGARFMGGARVSPWFFDMLDVRPVVGSGFLTEADGSLPRDQVIIAHDLWQELFGGDPDIIGQSIDVPPRSYTVVGVLPAGVDLPLERDLWIPLDLSAAPWMLDRSVRPFRVYGRLAPDVGLASARRRLATVASGLAAEFPGSNEGIGARVQRLKSTITGEIEQPLLLMQAAVVLVLLVACFNVANLTLAAATARRRELAMYAALGATRGRVLRRMLVESGLVAVAGGALGVGTVYGALGMLRSAVPVDLPRLEGLAVDPTVLLFAVACTAAAIVAAGLGPALRLAPRSGKGAEGPIRGLRGATIAGGRLSRVLLVAELALSTVLLAGAGLFLRSVIYLGDTELGLRVDGVQTLRVSVPDTMDPVQTSDALLARLGALPGVEAAVATSHVPVSGQYMDVEASLRGGATAGPSGPRFSFRMISPGYFDALDISVLRGRDFDVADRADGRRVGLVNQTAARRYWPGRDPVGEMIALEDQPQRLGEAAWIEIVGVVGDVRHHGPAAEPVAEIYVPYAQAGEAWNWTAETIAFLLAHAGGTGPGERQIREAVRDVGAEIPLFGVVTLAAYRGAQVEYTWLLSRLLQVFAMLALALAAVGVYGVVSCVVRLQTRDLGVRMALGARRSRVLLQVMSGALGNAAIGAAVGLVVALGLGRWLQHLLYGVTPTDAPTLAGTVGVLLLATAAAAYAPARRASRVDPARVLRGD